MNKLTPDGMSVIDATGKSWALEVAHPMPLPDGIEDSPTMLYWESGFRQWSVQATRDSTYRLLRPWPPAPKTQEEMDDEAFTKWFVENNRQGCASIPRASWHAALAYERGRKQP